MFAKKLPWYFTLISCVLVVVGCYFLFHTNANATAASPTSEKAICYPNIVELHGYKYVNPLLYAESECESEELAPLKGQILEYLESAKQQGTLTSASVYIELFDKHGDWIVINPDEEYKPASLLKLPVLFTFAKMAETDPGVLNKKVTFGQHDASLPKPAFPSKQLQPGHQYSVRELLEYMIAYSDNDALYQLYNFHNPVIYKKVFTELGLPYAESARDVVKGMKVKQYSMLMNVLYNGSYLSPASSEFALSLLAESDFKDGILKGLPAGTKTVHKFGEFYSGNLCELHESGIVYTDKGNYIITVMTTGTDMKQLSEVIGNVSRLAYMDVSAR